MLRQAAFFFLLILSSIYQNMGRVLILHFMKRDNILRIKLDDDTPHQTEKDLHEFLLTKSHDIGSENFELQFINDSGKFGKFGDSAVIKWPSNFLTVLIVDMNECHSNEPLLSIRGRAFDSSTGLPIFRDGNYFSTIHIKEKEEAELGTGLITWDGAIVLAKYLETLPDNVRNKNVLELGAGTGVAGMAASLLGAKNVLLTDLPYTLENLKMNVDRNLGHIIKDDKKSSVQVCALDWSDKDTYRHNPYYDVHVDRGPILELKTIPNIESKSNELKFIESLDVVVEGDCSCAINDDLNRILISNIDSTCRSVNNSANIQQKNKKSPTSSSIATTTVTTTTNVVMNKSENNIRELDGTSEWDVIIGADVVWLEELVPHLINVLVHLIGPNTVLLLSHQKRSERTDLLLFSGLNKYFVMEQIPHSRYHPDYNVPLISVYRGTKRRD